MRYAEYLAYLRSDAWKAVRRRFYQSGLFKGGCFCCGQRGIPLQMHHRSYRRLGHERLHDLCAVCDSCHVLLHAILKRASQPDATRKERNFDLFRVAHKIRKKVQKRGVGWLKTRRKQLNRIFREQEAERDAPKKVDLNGKFWPD